MLGLDVWFQTLRARANLGVLWGSESAEMQSMLQQRFSCYGYLSSVSSRYQQDLFCTRAVVAAEKPGCLGLLSNYANGFLDLIFTAMFGIVGPFWSRKAPTVKVFDF
ncbi:hypothetical protein LPUS_11327 [Lasallia pustulata]|nr:hypothetical protein LPUS_11327 [Lasallia pustulata]